MSKINDQINKPKFIAARMVAYFVVMLVAAWFVIGIIGFINGLIFKGIVVLVLAVVGYAVLGSLRLAASDKFGKSE